MTLKRTWILNQIALDWKTKPLNRAQWKEIITFKKHSVVRINAQNLQIK